MSCYFFFVFQIRSSKDKDATNEKLDCNKPHKSPHLVNVKITGITGSAVELQLIEYLLTIAVALERLFYESDHGDTESELKLSRVLLGIPRASTKAHLVCLSRTMYATVRFLLPHL